ncbi:MAG: ATP-binding protein [Alphaproteobacteria bacterium]
MPAAFDAVPTPIAVVDRRLRPLRRNAAWNALLPDDAGDPGTWPDPVVAALAAALRGEPATVRLDRDGDAVTEIRAHAIRVGRRRALVLAAAAGGTGPDAETERAVALGQLLASIVHELNNQLATILAQTQLVRRGTRNAGHGERLDRAIEAARQSARIVTNLLDLSRRRPVRRAPLAINAIVQRAAGLVQGRAERDGVVFEHHLADALPAVAGDATGLTQVVVNLLTNACDALAEVPPPRRIRLTTACDGDARLVELRVADNGPGIPPQIVRRIFQPFFTTKPEGKGTGLGLSLCVTQVKELGGGITVANRPEGGAEFVVRLPAVEAVAPAATAANAARPAGGAAILVVDDDEQLARYVQSLLRREGHAVDLATDGVEALRRADRRRYDLVVADIHMAGMDGTELYRRLERQHPDLAARVLFVTGDVANPELEQFFVLAGRPVLAKPFADDRFLAVVTHLLGRA